MHGFALFIERHVERQKTKDGASGQFCPEAKKQPRDQLAEKAGVSPKTYNAAKLILDAEESGEIAPEVAQAGVT